MNGMWTALAAEVLDRDKMDAMATLVPRIGLSGYPDGWDRVSEVRGVTFHYSSPDEAICTFFPIPDLRLEALTFPPK
jgi:hypothetical protein